MHNAVTNIDAILIGNTKVDVPVKDVFQKAVEGYSRYGYPEEWKLHHQGGATGYNTRDYKAHPESVEQVVENQAFAWNPSITGTKSEDTIIVMGKGFTVITEMKDWPLIEIEVDKKRIKRPNILSL